MQFPNNGRVTTSTRNSRSPLKFTVPRMGGIE